MLGGRAEGAAASAGAGATGGGAPRGTDDFEAGPAHEEPASPGGVAGPEISDEDIPFRSGSAISAPSQARFACNEFSRCAPSRSHLFLAFGHADVIHQHALREHSRGIRRARPIAADGDIQNNKKGMVEHPGAARRPLRAGKRRVQVRIKIETHDTWFPLRGIKMKIVRQALAVRQRDGLRQIAGGICGAWPVQRAVINPRFLADVFHDVDLATFRPAVRGNIFAKHPEGRPNSLPRRQLDPRLKSPIGLREQALGLQTRRRVTEALAVRSPVALRARRNYLPAASSSTWTRTPSPAKLPTRQASCRHT